MAARQAIVVIHGMGEQRPVETLNRFSRVITPEGGTFYSKADKVAGSFEARRHLIPSQPGLGTQTEIYEYHWAHLMRGNRVGDLLPMLRRLLLPVPGWWGAPLTLLWLAIAFVVITSVAGPEADRLPVAAMVALGVVAIVGLAYSLRYVPTGLAVLWVVLWTAIGWVAWATAWGPLSAVVRAEDVPSAIKAIAGGGLTAVAVTYLLTRALPKWLTSSFVDVVRYLDTSPRSYEVRRNIRQGIIDLLKGLHEYGRYERIVVVAHSLGSYIAYDAISYLWTLMAKLHRGPVLSKQAAGGCRGGVQPEGLAALERAASNLGTPEAVDGYQAAQRDLWVGLRRQGNPWLVTDFISFGSPMYFAHQLYTRDREQFDDRVDRHELVTCPPQNEKKPCNNVNDLERFFSWNNRGRRVLHDAAPFAVVRWTNLFYKPFLGVFGDWFAGRLAPLFGPGVKDVAVEGNRRQRWIPGAAHALYLASPSDHRPGSFAAHLGSAIGLNAASWLPDRSDTPNSDEETRNTNVLWDESAEEG